MTKDHFLFVLLSVKMEAKIKIKVMIQISLVFELLPVWNIDITGVSER